MFTKNDLLKKRVYAITADFSIIVVANYFFMAAFTNFIKTIFFHFPLRAQLIFIEQMTIMTSVSLMSLTFAYFSIFYFVTNGSTMGKTLFGIRVQAKNGEMTLKQSMLRAFAYFTCAMLGSFLFAISFLRKDHKSLADMMSNTSVAYDTKEDYLTNKTEFQLALLDSINQNTDNKQIEISETEEAA